MKPFKKMTRPRKAWLITWESGREDYLADLKRPKIVCILDSHLQYRSIRRILPALYCSEKRFSLSEKVVYGTCREVRRGLLHKEFGFDNDILTYGEDPWLYARKVENLYVEAHRFTQVLHWTELPRCKVDGETTNMIETVSRKTRSFTQRYRWCVDF